MPRDSNNEDRQIISVQDILLLTLAWLVNKAKLEECQLLVARLAWHPGETYWTLPIVFPGAEGAQEDEVAAINILLPQNTPIDHIVC